MNNIITPQEVVNIAFPANSNMKEESINEFVIHATEIKYLRPALGEELYSKLSIYPELCEELKPALAFFVKCELIPSLSLSMSNGGIAIANPQYMSAATDKQRTLLYESELSKAHTLLEEVLVNIAQSGKYPEYRVSTIPRRKSYGGIIL
ncbi:MAG: hypothetical protein IIW52_05295 [Alistipes sp.]|nr:hypothetical protein [Alistipes sp.]